MIRETWKLRNGVVVRFQRAPARWVQQSKQAGHPWSLVFDVHDVRYGVPFGRSREVARLMYLGVPVFEPGPWVDPDEIIRAGVGSFQMYRTLESARERALRVLNKHFVRLSTAEAEWLLE